MKTYALLTAALHGGEWSASRPGFSTPREIAAGTHRRRGSVGSRDGLDAVVMKTITCPSR